MERLTEKIGSKYCLKHCLEENPCSETSGICLCGECSFPQKAHQKLGEYEDLEEQGKLLKLDFKYQRIMIGQEIFVVEDGAVKSKKICHIKHFRHQNLNLEMFIKYLLLIKEKNKQPSSEVK